MAHTHCVLVTKATDNSMAHTHCLLVTKATDNSMAHTHCMLVTKATDKSMAHMHCMLVIKATDDSMVHTHCVLVTKATDTHSEYAMFIAFPREERLHELVSVLVIRIDIVTTPWRLLGSLFCTSFCCSNAIGQGADVECDMCNSLWIPAFQ